MAQCNAMISIADQTFLERAWCSVEILIMQTLRDSYNVHEHWDYELDNPNAVPDLTRGVTVPPIDDELTGLHLSYPDQDEPTVKALVRQSRIPAKGLVMLACIGDVHKSLATCTRLPLMPYFRTNFLLYVKVSALVGITAIEFGLELDRICLDKHPFTQPVPQTPAMVICYTNARRT
jgi:hypothetical protein